MGQKEKLLKRLQERPEDAIAKTIRSLSPRSYQIITLHNGIAGSAGLSIEPSLMEIAKLVIFTCETGSMNWIRASRTIGFEFKTRVQHLPDGFNFGWVSPSDFQPLPKKCSKRRWKRTPKSLSMPVHPLTISLPSCLYFE